MKRKRRLRAAAVVLVGYFIGRGLGTFVVRSPMRSTGITPKTSDIKATEKAVSYAEQGCHYYNELARQTRWLRLRRNDKIALSLHLSEREYCRLRAMQLRAYLVPGFRGLIEVAWDDTVERVRGLGSSGATLPTATPAASGKRPARPYRVVRDEIKAQRRHFRQLLKASRAHQQNGWEDAAYDMLYLELSRNQRRCRSGFGLD